MRIFAKLFLLLAALVIVPLVAVLIVLVQNTGKLKEELTEQVDLTGDLVSDKSELALLKQVELTHLKIIQEKAGRLETFFESIRSAIQLQSTLTRQYLISEVPLNPAYPIFTADEVFHLRENNHLWRQFVFEKSAYSMYQLVTGVDPESVKDTLQRLRQLGGFFQHAFHVIPGCASAYLGHRDGITFGYPGGSKFSPQYDPRQRPWYKLAQERRTITWTPVYYDRGNNGLIVTCAGPVYSQTDGSLIAVTAVDVRLKELIHELFSLGDLKVSAAMLIDDEGKVRVSATYADGKTTFDSQTLLNPPKVSDFHDLGLRQAYDIITASKASSGLIQGTGAGGYEDLYIHADVRFRSQTLEGSGVMGVPLGGQAKQGEQAGGVWRYVLKVPLGPVVKPAQEIRADVTQATSQMRTTMEDQVVALAVVVAGITAIAMAIALALAYFFASSATKPLVQMEQVAGQIAKGNFDQQVEVRSRDEIGELGNAINEMIIGLKERDFIKDTFKHYVAASVVEELLRDHTKLRLGGEERDLTIFFSDLSGFTSISEKLSPEELVRLLNEYLGSMTDSILAQEGTLDKYIGDAIVAFWGAPFKRDDDAVRACRTALDHLHRLSELWPDWERRGLPKLDVRIGIQSGPVVVGNVGSKKRKNYTVIGDTANTSSRLEGANKVYGTRILIGEPTRRAAGDAIVAREIDLIAVKGKSDSVRVYELIGLKGEVSAARLEAIRTFEQALADYRAQRWSQATAGFERVIQMVGDDTASRVFIQRIAQFREEPPAAGWDGSYAMTEK